MRRSVRAARVASAPVPESASVPPVVAIADPDALALAAEALRNGGAVVLPTDTVYGVAALPSGPGAIAGLFKLKDRSAGQPLAVLVADANQAASLAAPVTRPVAAWMMEQWPGPLTLVLPRSEAARDLELGGSGDTLGIRCPAHPFVRSLTRRIGPIATTS